MAALSWAKLIFNLINLYNYNILSVPYYCMTVSHLYKEYCTPLHSTAINYNKLNWNVLQITLLWGNRVPIIEDIVSDWIEYVLTSKLFFLKIWMKPGQKFCVYKCADFLKAINFKRTNIHPEKICAVKCAKTLKERRML